MSINDHGESLKVLLASSSPYFFNVVKMRERQEIKKDKVYREERESLWVESQSLWVESQKLKLKI